MNATKLTLIALTATAIMFAGCSTDNPVVGPVNDLQSEVGINNAGRVDNDTFDHGTNPERFTIFARVQIADFENDCFYLEADDGNTYSPVPPRDLSLKKGMALKADGYIDRDIESFCGKGPAFVIERYEIIDAGRDGSDFDIILTNGNEDRAPSRYTEDRNSEEPNAAEQEFKKKLEEESRSTEPQNEEVPPVITDDNNEQWSSPSDERYSEEERMAREQEAKKKLEEERGTSEPSNEEAPPTMSDNDNDRDFRSSEDRVSQEEIRRIESELKKKLEEEQSGNETGNERP